MLNRFDFQTNLALQALQDSQRTIIRKDAPHDASGTVPSAKRFRVTEDERDAERVTIIQQPKPIA